MRRSKQARAREFSCKTRKAIIARDYGRCIFCNGGFQINGATWLALDTLDIMHYIPRSHGGLGIPENGALGCRFHHERMDNGNKGERESMLAFFKGYLQGIYPDWDEERLIYDKWDFLEGGG